MSEGTNITAQRIEELTHEPIDLVPYDPCWPQRYAEEEQCLRALLPPDAYTRMDHIGSTAVPGLSAKPIIDVQVQVVDLERIRNVVAPVLVAQGYEFIWRPTMGERAPFYAWFIKRNARRERSHHIHMVEPDAVTADRLLFRDHLRAHPELAQRYEALKQGLSMAHHADRAAYTLAKTPFIAQVLALARTEQPR